MKKILLTVTLVLAISLSSCDDFFNIEPTGSIEVNDYATQLNNLRLSLNSVYALMQTEDYQLSELIFGECISDNAYTPQDNNGSELCQLLNFQFNTENSYIRKRYELNFRGVNLTNQIIHAVPNINYNENYPTGAQEIRYILGQAKMLRALFYFNLVRTYGGVSIQPEDSELHTTTIPRSSTDEVYALIEKDLREACLILFRDRYKEAAAGQGGIGAGLGLLLKVLVYQASVGTQLEHPDRTKKWQEAKEIAELFIDGKGMSYDQILKFSERYSEETWETLCKRLVLTDQNPTPKTMFPASDVANVHGLIAYDQLFRLKSRFNKESLLEINHFDYSASGSNVDKKNYLYRSFNNNEGYSVGVAPTQAVYDFRKSDPRGLYLVKNGSDNSDFFYDENGNAVSLGWFNTAYGYVFCKYMVYPNEGTVEQRTYLIMRYAEALLFYAEILNETGDQAKATTMLNRIRNRAAKLLDPSHPDSKYNSHIATFPLYDVMPYEEVKKNIQYERRVELAGEFDRWYDLQRQGLLTTQMAYLASKNGEAADKNSGKPRWRGKYFRSGVNEIMPIPQYEITISNGVIKQNFGY
ncbi:RagB/SusD family nutrient uptake outer membrane protein [Bacteroides sp.]